MPPGHPEDTREVRRLENKIPSQGRLLQPGRGFTGIGLTDTGTMSAPMRNFVEAGRLVGEQIEQGTSSADKGAGEGQLTQKRKRAPEEIDAGSSKIAKTAHSKDVSLAKSKQKAEENLKGVLLKGTEYVKYAIRYSIRNDESDYGSDLSDGRKAKAVMEAIRQDAEALGEALEAGTNGYPHLERMRANARLLQDELQIPTFDTIIGNMRFEATPDMRSRDPDVDQQIEAKMQWKSEKTPTRHDDAPQAGMPSSSRLDKGKRPAQHRDSDQSQLAEEAQGYDKQTYSGKIGTLYQVECINKYDINRILQLSIPEETKKVFIELKGMTPTRAGSKKAHEILNDLAFIERWDEEANYGTEEVQKQMQRIIGSF